MKRLRLIAPIVSGILLASCCPGGTCIKDPPCRPCEDPCCLSPIQRKALEGGTHALPDLPVVYTYEEKTYFLFTEAGLKDFEKDPTSFEEKGALRVIKAGKTRRVDVNPGEGFDWASVEGRARPFVPAPKK